LQNTHGTVSCSASVSPNNPNSIDAIQITNIGVLSQQMIHTHNITTIHGAHSHNITGGYVFYNKDHKPFNVSYQEICDLLENEQEQRDLINEFPAVKQAYEKFLTVLKLHK